MSSVRDADVIVFICDRQLWGEFCLELVVESFGKAMKNMK